MNNKKHTNNIYLPIVRVLHLVRPFMGILPEIATPDRKVNIIYTGYKRKRKKKKKRRTVPLNKTG